MKNKNPSYNHFFLELYISMYQLGRNLSNYIDDLDENELIDGRRYHRDEENSNILVLDLKRKLFIPDVKAVYFYAINRSKGLISDVYWYALVNNSIPWDYERAEKDLYYNHKKNKINE